MDSWILTFAVVLTIYLAYKIVRKKIYFKAYGIPQPFELPFLGCIDLSFFEGEHMSSALSKIYRMEMNAKYIACYSFSSPIIIVRDLELIKSICVRNFEYFADRKELVNGAADPLLGRNLAFLNGNRWREFRNILSPSFTSSKMRMMFAPMSHYAKNFVSQLTQMYHGDEAVDIKDVFSRYTNDIIAACVFGIDVNSLENSNNDFFRHGKNSVSASFTLMLKIFAYKLFPDLSCKMGVRVVSKKSTSYFIGIIKAAIEEREKQGKSRPDMLQLMINANKEKGSFDLVDMTAQAFIFFVGGFETTSSHLSMMAHEIAMNPEIQKKLQSEIDAALEESNDEPGYDTINNMVYLDAVFHETLRMHPLSSLSRVCCKEFELPPALPPSKPFIIKPGMEILIPVSAVHRDPKYFENPDTFDPTRFIDKEFAKKEVMKLGFGLGPRMCIGNRFAVLVSKILMFNLFRQCTLTMSKKTRLPLKYDKNSFSPIPKGGAWLKIQSRKSRNFLEEANSGG